GRSMLRSTGCKNITPFPSKESHVPEDESNNKKHSDIYMKMVSPSAINNARKYSRINGAGGVQLSTPK
ncbi:19773_t:CDS:2, partial [Entrophospora sp. SA101]